GGGGVFQRLETGVDLVAQGLEPDAGALAALNHQGGVSLDHEGFNHDAAFLNSPAGCADDSLMPQAGAGGLDPDHNPLASGGIRTVPSAVRLCQPAAPARSSAEGARAGQV